jgi:hypothetical protein
MAIGSDDFWTRSLREHLAARRERTGRKFETCARAQPTFAALDAAGWNDWPPSEPVRSREETEGDPMKHRGRRRR